jgi:hypothetical protein
MLTYSGNIYNISCNGQEITTYSGNSLNHEMDFMQSISFMNTFLTNQDHYQIRIPKDFSLIEGLMSEIWV